MSFFVVQQLPTLYDKTLCIWRKWTHACTYTVYM